MLLFSEQKAHCHLNLPFRVLEIQLSDIRHFQVRRTLLPDEVT
jgi:hypothetical protein